MNAKLTHPRQILRIQRLIQWLPVIVLLVFWLAAFALNPGFEAFVWAYSGGLALCSVLILSVFGAVALDTHRFARRRLTKTEVEQLTEWAISDPEVCVYLRQVQQIGQPLTAAYYGPVEDFIEAKAKAADPRAAESILASVLSKCGPAA